MIDPNNPWVVAANFFDDYLAEVADCNASPWAVAADNRQQPFRWLNSEQVADDPTFFLVSLAADRVNKIAIAGDPVSSVLVSDSSATCHNSERATQAMRKY